MCQPEAWYISKKLLFVCLKLNVKMGLWEFLSVFIFGTLSPGVQIKIETQIMATLISSFYSLQSLLVNFQSCRLIACFCLLLPPSLMGSRWAHLPPGFWALAGNQTLCDLCFLLLQWGWTGTALQTDAPQTWYRWQKTSCLLLLLQRHRGSRLPSFYSVSHVPSCLIS